MQNALEARSPALPWGKMGIVGLLAVGGLLGLLWLGKTYVAVAQHDAFGSQLGKDYTIYIEATHRWLAGGTFYLPEQLAGPYEIVGGVVLYPPIALFLFVPFTVLPAAFWWAIPLAITGWVVWSYRPALWGWVTILAVFTMSYLATWVVIFGTPTIWMVAFVALGVRYGWPAALVVLKPTLGLFAIVGIRDRRWWATMAGLAAVSLAMLPLWLDWLTILHNARGPRVGFWYSFDDVPLMLVPIIGRAASRRRSRARSGG